MGLIGAPNLLTLANFTIPAYRFRGNDLTRLSTSLYCFLRQWVVQPWAFNEVLSVFDFDISRENFRNEINEVFIVR